MMMPMRILMMVLFIIAGLCIILPPVVAETGVQDVVLYQVNFATDPHWITNSPRSYYWVPEKGVYHYAIEASTGAYAYIKVNYYDGPFTLEYDLTPQDTDLNSAFHMGLTKDAMLRTEGPVALTEFTNDRGRKLMSIRAVTPSNNLFEVTSYSFSYGAKTGAKTVNFVDNRTYHVVLDYDNERNTLTMRVYEKATGTQIWGYFLTLNEEMHAMDRIALGPLGDFSSMGPVAEGYIDNVILTAQKKGTVAPTTEETIPPAQTITVTRTMTKSTVKPTTPTSTEEKATPVSIPTIIAALGISGTAMVCRRIVKKR